MIQNFPEGLRIVLFGVLGGLLYVIAFGLRPFRKVQKLSDGSVSYDFGWIKHVVLGGAAAYIVWVTGLGNPNPPQSDVLAILSGIVGAQFVYGYSIVVLFRELINKLPKDPNE